MWNLLSRILKIKFAIILLAVTGAWNVYQIAKPDKPNLDRLRMEIGEQACWAIIDSLPHEITPSQRTAVLRFAGDNTRYITGKLEELIERTGKVSLMDKSLFDKVLKELRIEDEHVGSFDKAIEIGTKSGADYVLFGEIEKFVSDRNQASINMNVRMIDVSAQKVIMTSVIDVQPSVTEIKVRTISPWSRILLWIVFTLSMPLIFVKTVKHVLARESNAANFVLVGSLTFASVFLALVLCSFDLSSMWVGLLILIGFVGSASYNYWVCSYLEELC